jgi:phage/plasmid-like protein (TIGR03299 family)
LTATGKVAYESAGALSKGGRVWILARVCGDAGRFCVAPEDPVEKFLLLSNGHDGRTALQIRFTPIRVVCQNTLSAALACGSNVRRIHHTRDLHRRMAQAQEAVAEIFARYDDLTAQYERFAKRPMVGDLLPRYLKAIFPDPKRRGNQTDRSYEQSVARTRRLRENSGRLFGEGKGNQLPSIRGTLWAAYNGVTELVDHHMAYRNRDHWLESLWFGEGERTKLVAFQKAVQLSNNGNLN